MDTRDKEFDGLFRSALEDVQVEPNLQVWQGINAELNKGNQRRLFKRTIAIAACLFLFAVASLVVYRADDKKIKKRAGKALVAKSVIKAENIKTKINKTNAAANYVAVQPGPKKLRLSASQPLVKIVENKNKVSEDKVVRPVLASLNEKPGTDSVVTGNKLIRDAGLNNPALNSKLTALADVPVVSAQASVTGKQDAGKAKRKNKIRSFGDLVNVVIARVDKRQDKLIEFTDTDDDEATITGVNLGIIKIKKEDK